MFAQGNPLLDLSDFMKEEQDVDSLWSDKCFSACPYFGLVSRRPCSFTVSEGAFFVFVSLGKVESAAAPHLLETIESRVGGDFVFADGKLEWQVSFELEQLDQLGWTSESFYHTLDDNILYIESALLLRERYPMREFDQLLLPLEHYCVGRDQ